MYLLDSSGYHSIVQAPSRAYLGEGVFETMRARVCESGGFFIAGFLQHCERLQQGVTALELFRPAMDSLSELAELELASAQNKAQGQEELKDLLLRFVVNKDSAAAFASPFTAHSWVQTGVRLKGVKLARPLPHLKHSSALISLESERQAKKASFDTALLSSAEGIFTECSWANFVWVSKEGVVCSNKEGVLPGVTEALLASLLPIEHRPLSRELLESGECKAAVITQATSGVVAVKEIDGIALDFELARAQLAEPFLAAVSDAVVSKKGIKGSTFANAVK